MQAENIDRKLQRTLKVGSVVLKQSFLASETGGALWDAAFALGDAIATLSPGAKVLELGAGIGYNAILAAQRGAQVVATDCDAEVIALLRSNAAPFPNVEVRYLCWGTAVSERFDVVMASDVLFDPDLYEALLLTLRSLRHPGTTFHLTYRERNPEQEQFFLQQLGEATAFPTDEEGIKRLTFQW